MMMQIDHQQWSINRSIDFDFFALTGSESEATVAFAAVLLLVFY
jgi:hypothetical protein